MAVITAGRGAPLDNTTDDPTRRAPLILGHDFASITDTVCGLAEAPKPTKAWYGAFAISSAFLLDILVTPALLVLISRGRGAA